MPSAAAIDVSSAVTKGEMMERSASDVCCFAVANQFWALLRSRLNVFSMGSLFSSPIWLLSCPFLASDVLVVADPDRGFWLPLAAAEVSPRLDVPPRFEMSADCLFFDFVPGLGPALKLKVGDPMSSWVLPEAALGSMDATGLLITSALGASGGLV